MQNKLIYGIIAIVAIIMAGCKPEKLVVPNADSYANIFMQSALDNPISNTFYMEDKWYDIPFGAGYGGVNLPTEDITVTFKVDPTLVDIYNDENSTNYPIMPEESYRLTGTTSIIANGGTGTGVLKLQINPSKLNGIGTHILPISIEKASNGVSIAEDLRTTFYLVNSTYETNPYTDISRTSWSIADFSTDENENASGGRAQHAIDGLINTFWTTQWRDVGGVVTKPGPPHYITIDMGKTEEIHGLKLAARVDANGVPRDRGNPKRIVVETSSDNINWTYSEAFTVENIPESTIYLEYTQNARYFKIIVLETHMSFYGTHLAEINAF